MKSKEELQLIFSEINETIQSIKDVSNGCDQDVALVQCLKKSYIYKEPKKEPHKLENEVIACALAKNLGIPAPIIIKKTDTYLIESVIRGKDFRHNKHLQLYKQLGKYIKLLHGEKAPYIGEKGWKISTNHLEIYNKHMPKDIKTICTYYPDKQEEIENYFQSNIHYLDYVNPVYLHGDLVDEHVFFEDNSITGIIDWADIFGGRAEDDIGKFYFNHPDDDSFKAFMKGYGPIDMDAVRYFAVYFITWQLAGDIRAKKFNFPKKEKLFFDIIDKFNEIN